MSGTVVIVISIITIEMSDTIVTFIYFNNYNKRHYSYI